MQSFSQLAIFAFSSMTILMQIASLFLFGIILVRKFQPRDKTSKQLASFISDNFLLITFILTAGATAGSLVMSDVLGFLPCKLCWYQRIFMYPQLLISGIAFFKGETSVKKYLLSLSVIGGLIAFYQVVLQLFPNIATQCGDEIVSCTKSAFYGFGYITIPVMSLTTFVLLILIALISNPEKKN